MNFIETWIVPPESTASPAVYICVALVALTVTSISKGGFGGGIGVLAVPLLLQVAPLRFAIGVFLPVLIACDMTIIQRYPRQWEPRILYHLAPGMLVGILLASLLLALAGKDSAATVSLKVGLQLAIVATCVAFVGIKLLPLLKRERSDDDAPPWRPGWAVHLPIGFIAGITTTIAHAAGPIFDMYCLPQKLDQRVFVGTGGRIFFIANSLKVPLMFAVGVMSLHTLQYGLWLILLAPFGVAVGSWLNRRISAELFVRVVYFSLLIAAGKLAYDAVQTLGQR